MTSTGQKNSVSTKQRAIIDAMMQRQVFVRAGAGTGKTKTMVDGIVDKLRHCPDAEKDDFFNHVFMVTFTNNAAAELKTRLRTKLLEEQDEAVRRQADRIEDAWVSTIHGLCSRILRMYALEAGIQPNFQVCSEEQREVLLHTARDEVSKELLAETRYQALFEFFGFEKQGEYDEETASDMAEAIAEKLTESISVDDVQWIPYDEEAVQNVIESYPAKIYAECMQVLEREAREKMKPAQQQAWEKNKEMAETLYDAAQKHSSLEELFFYIMLWSMPTPTSLGLTSKIAQTPVEKLKAELLSCLAYRIFFTDLEAPLFEFAKKIHARYDELKEEAGLLDNNDLLSKCYTFLHQQNPSICHSFTLAIVDEFQDTNEQQLEIIRLLAKDKNALCFVGDAQQSIYRFRGADVDLYNKIKDEIGKEDAVKIEKEKSIFELSTNYRSQEDILSFVDHMVNDPTALKDFLPLSVPEHMSDAELSPIEKHIRKSPLWNGKRILVEHTIAKGVGASNRHIAANRSQVAERVAEIIHESDGAIRPRDVAVLTRKGQGVDQIARALHEVGCDALRVNQTIANVAEYDEIEHLLIALANPADTKNGVLPLLTGPMFEIPYDDLVLISKGSELVHLPDFFTKSAQEVKQEMPEKLDERTYQAFDLLSSLRSLRKQLSVSELVEYVCVQSGWLARIAKDTHSRSEQVANLFNAYGVIQTIVDDAGYGLRSAPELFNLWRKSQKGRAAILNSSEKGAVIVETVHQSKGLQYPIVVVDGEMLTEASASRHRLLMASFEGKTYLTFNINLTKRQRSHLLLERLQSKCPSISGLNAQILESLNKAMKVDMTDASFQDVQNARLELRERIKLLPWQGVNDVCLVEEEAEQAEQWRLLYVAMTRAKNGLVICVPQKMTKSNVLSANSQFAERFDEVLQLSCGISPAEYDFPLKNISVHIRKDLLDATEHNPCDIEDIEEPVLEPFYVFENTEKPLAKIPWGYMQDVSSFSSDSHQAEEALSSEDQAETAPRELDLKTRQKEAQKIVERVVGKPEFEFGTAFHALAELAALMRKKPTAEQIEARARFHRLDAERTQALAQAFDAWWNSPLRKEAFGMPHLEPEYPFFMKDATDDNKLYKRGFIDLLAFDGTRALVVDYKTGEQNMSAREAHEAHINQCEWYARALLMSGFSEVTVKFVLVQNLDKQNRPFVLDFGAYTQDRLDVSDAKNS